MTSDDDRVELVAWTDGSDTTCAELRDRLTAEQGVAVIRSPVNAMLVASGLPLKKVNRYRGVHSLGEKATGGCIIQA